MSSRTAENKEESGPCKSIVDNHGLCTLFREFENPESVIIGLQRAKSGAFDFIDTDIVLLSQGIIEF